MPVVTRNCNREVGDALPAVAMFQVVTNACPKRKAGSKMKRKIVIFLKFKMCYILFGVKISI